MMGLTHPIPGNLVCAKCGASAPAGALGGLCPRCLVLEGLMPCESDADPGSEEIRNPLLRYFGDYELLNEIARGGMGVVYRARQLSLNRLVAVKLLPAGPLARSDYAARFRSEAQAAASLQHPNIVAIYEVGEHEGQPYFAMEYIEGENLSARVRLGPVPVVQAVAWVRVIADAIHYAHSRGLIHRDLKPSNILIDPFGQPRITDFGLAKQLQAESDLTVTGELLGTPSFMSPEQASGAKGAASPASDVYALGTILYFLLTSRPPFQAESLSETLVQVRMAEPVRPRRLNASVPVEVETICLKCLEKPPGGRYLTAGELADDLGRFANGEPIRARPVGPAGKAWRWCRRKPAIAALAAALHVACALGLAGVFWQWRRAELNAAHEAREHQRAEGETERARQLQYASDMNLSRLAVDDGDLFRARQLLDRWVPGDKAENRKQKAETDLRGWEWHYLSNQCQGDERFILGYHTNGATAVGVLPDGKTVFSAGSDKCIRLWDLESQRQIGMLKHPEAVLGAAASPDGRWLATVMENVRVGNQPVLLWDLATREVAAILATNFWPRSTLAFSPDSKLLAWTSEKEVHLYHVASRSEITNLSAYYLYPGWGPLGVAFSPDSKILAYNEDDAGVIRLWDVAKGVSAGQLAGHKRGVWAIAFSPDGRSLACGVRDRTLRLVSLADQRELFALTNRSLCFDSLAFSPDGRTLAAGGGEQSIRLLDVQTGVQTAELKGHLKPVTGLAFSPDGQTLVSASADGSVRGWGAAPHRKSATSQLLPPDVSVAWGSYGPALCLSPDGRFLLTVHTNQTFTIWNTLELTASSRHPLPYPNPTIAAVAPGGQLAAFASENGEVALWDAQSGQSKIFAQAGTNALNRMTFSLDGRRLATGGMNEVRVFDLATRRQTHVLAADGQYPMALVFSQDGESLIAGFFSGDVKLWRFKGTSNSVDFTGHKTQVRGIALSLDGQTLYSSAKDEIRFWDVSTRQQKLLLTPKIGLFFGCVLSPDGQRLALGSSDAFVTVWDLASLQEVATLKGHGDTVMHMAFTPDGNNLVSVSIDQFRVWRSGPSSQQAGKERQVKSSLSKP